MNREIPVRLSGGRRRCHIPNLRGKRKKNVEMDWSPDEEGAPSRRPVSPLIPEIRAASRNKPETRKLRCSIFCRVGTVRAVRGWLVGWMDRGVAVPTPRGLGLQNFRYANSGIDRNEIKMKLTHTPSLSPPIRIAGLQVCPGKCFYLFLRKLLYPALPRWSLVYPSLPPSIIPRR